MEASAISFPLVFLAGIASFLSPCVLPLVPGYLAFVGAGAAADEDTGSTARPLVSSAGFVLGFTIIFVALGLTLTALGSFLFDNQRLLTRISGGLIILMGLVFLGVIPLPWLYSEKRMHARPARSFNGSLVMGLAFGFGWTPCIGPALGAVLALAATEPTPGRGGVLLAVYSAGLGIPFILSALGADRAVRAVSWLRRRQAQIVTVSGSMLIAVGLLFLFDRVFWLSAKIQSTMTGLGLDFWTSL